MLSLKHSCVRNKPLSEIATFGIGGPAKLFLEVKTIEQMIEVVTKCAQEKIAYIVIGKASNILFNSQGFDGLVIHNKIDFFQEPTPGHFYVGAGLSFALLGRNTARRGWSGLEFAGGIPASVGGAVFMNAGAQGSETKDVLEYVDFVGKEGLVRLQRADIDFGYRTSSFQNMQGAIVAAAFSLHPAADAPEKQQELLHYRMATQPYSDKSAGCVFRNPLGHSAGALIEAAGLKGYAVNDASVSEKHANFIINRGSATSSDVCALIEHVQKKVKEMTGIDLEVEIRFL